MIVVILDDDPAILEKYEVMIDALIQQGYDIDCSLIQQMNYTTDFAETMSQMGRPIDVAILDFDLIGQGTGNDAARQIRAVSPKTRLVGNSGGDPKRFDRQFVDRVIPAKIKTPDEMKDAIYGRF